MKVPEVKVPPGLPCALLCSISEVSERFVSSFALFQVPLYAERNCGQLLGVGG